MSTPLFQWLNSRGAGVLLHPTSLPGPTGIGTLGREARRFIDFLSEAGMKFWQVCPLGPTGFGDSPYQCFSAFAGNPYLIDFEAFLERGLLSPEDLGQLRVLPIHYVDYGAQWRLRWQVLRKAFANFRSDCSARERQQFRVFVKANKAWLDPYTRFIALKAKFEGRSWHYWPTEFKRYSTAKRLFTKSLTSVGADLRADREFAEEVDAHAFYQFEFFKQWISLKEYAHSRGIQIVGDIPIFVAMDSADVWTNPALFHMDEDLNPTGLAGVPPDYFSADGQLWGNPLYDWKYHESQGFAWWLSRLEAVFELYDIVRVDHFRGFDEYCRIPPDALNAREFTWEPGPGLKLFKAIKAEFPDAKLIAEDLGIITDSVRKLVKEAGVPGMQVLQFGFEGATEYLPHNSQRNCVMYPGTHDNDTAWGWFAAQSEPVKDFFRRYLGVPGDAVPWDMIRAGYASAAGLFIVPFQDLLSLGSEARMNTPGQAVGNWRWRFTNEQLEQIQEQSVGHLRELAKLYER
jgi:4-alpha-glucanotransferase